MLRRRFLSLGLLAYADWAVKPLKLVQNSRVRETAAQLHGSSGGVWWDLGHAEIYHELTNARKVVVHSITMDGMLVC